MHTLLILVCLFLFMFGIYTNTAPPVITEEPPNTDLITGVIHSFTCAFRGRPLPAILWKRNADVLSNSTNVTISHVTVDDAFIMSTLTLVYATLEDIGLYECNATNEVDTVAATFHVNVFGRLSSSYLKTLVTWKT